jgi:hypothetical protein
MPFRVVDAGGGLVSVVNEATGRVAARATIPEKAAAQLRLLRAVDHGWKPGRKGGDRTG